MPVTPDAVSHLQAAGHDAIHTSSVGLAQATDPEIIEIARRDGRVVVTADLDYPRLALLSDAAGPGIVLLRGGSYPRHRGGGWDGRHRPPPVGHAAGKTTPL